KANMFLGAGSVMHGMDDEVDMRRYGALRKAMPVTFLTFAMGYLAIIGFPGFSGFWSKDKIIETAFSENWVVGLCALVGAGITGFYMTRLMLMTFFTESRWDPDVHPHESPKVMTVPLMVLAALSALGGLLLVGDGIVSWLSPVVGARPAEDLPVPTVVLSLLVLVVVAAGIAVAWFLVGRREVPVVAPQRVSVFTRVARAELTGDVFNDEVVVRPFGRLTKGMVLFDASVIDGAAEGTASSFAGMSGGLRLSQSGYVRSYALSFLGGAALVLIALLVVNL
ncbi:MAG: proton-conducting transporter membrane subunit, partial [Marmoricola sp.]